MTHLPDTENSCRNLERDMSKTLGSSGGDEMTCKNCLNVIILILSLKILTHGYVMVLLIF